MVDRLRAAWHSLRVHLLGRNVYCSACGTPLPQGRRRVCSDDCRDEMKAASQAW